MKSKFGHSETLYLGASSGTLFRDDDKFPVYMLKSGKFGVPWGSVFIAKDSLKTLDKTIAKLKQKQQSGKFLVLWQGRKIDKKNEEYPTFDVVEFKNSTGKPITTDGKEVRTWGALYLYDGTIADAIQKIDFQIIDLEKKIKDLEVQRRVEHDKLLEVHEDNFDKMLEEHGRTK